MEKSEESQFSKMILISSGPNVLSGPAVMRMCVCVWQGRGATQEAIWVSGGDCVKVVCNLINKRISFRASTMRVCDE